MGISMHDRYYEPEDDDSDLLNDRIADLLNTKYDITKDFALFAEGIQECSQADRDSVMTILQGNNINTIDFTQLGRKLWDIAFSYSESIAESHAYDDLSSGNLD
jgi:hypothetical protein